MPYTLTHRRLLKGARTYPVKGHLHYSPFLAPQVCRRLLGERIGRPLRYVNRNHLTCRQRLISTTATRGYHRGLSRQVLPPQRV